MLKRVSKKKIAEAILRKKYEMREDIHEVILNVTEDIENEFNNDVDSFLSKNNLEYTIQDVIEDYVKNDIVNLNSICYVNIQKKPEIEVYIDIKGRDIRDELNKYIDSGDIDNRVLDLEVSESDLIIKMNSNLPYLEDFIELKSLKDFIFKIYLRDEDRYDNDVSSLKEDVIVAMSKTDYPENIFKIMYDFEEEKKEIDKLISFIINFSR